MSSQSADLGHHEWSAALAAARSLSVSAVGLRSNREPVLNLIRTALRGVSDRIEALTLLGYLDSDFTLEVLPELVQVALSHRDALRVRQVLGRLSYDEAESEVPPAVWSLLAITNDDDAYRRMAELLRHLGLSAALVALLAKAAVDPDPMVREVAADFA